MAGDDGAYIMGFNILLDDNLDENEWYLVGSDDIPLYELSVVDVEIMELMELMEEVSTAPDGKVAKKFQVDFTGWAFFHSKTED